MSLPIETLEAFFGEKFIEGWQLTHFDGFLYWRLQLFPESSLSIIADRDSFPHAFPTVEIEGRYSDEVSVWQLGGGVGSVLVLRPEGADELHYVCITKRKDGRLSLATTAGVSRTAA